MKEYIVEIVSSNPESYKLIDIINHEAVLGLKYREKYSTILNLPTGKIGHTQSLAWLKPKLTNA